MLITLLTNCILFVLADPWNISCVKYTSYWNVVLLYASFIKTTRLWESDTSSWSMEVWKCQFRWASWSLPVDSHSVTLDMLDKLWRLNQWWMHAAIAAATHTWAMAGTKNVVFCTPTCSICLLKESSHASCPLLRPICWRWSHCWPFRLVA